MVGIGFMYVYFPSLQKNKIEYLPNKNDREKLLRLDNHRNEYSIVVVGEEAHLAYNRVGMTSFFQHRNVEELYLNPREWVRF